MAWIKRNLYFLIGSVVALALMGMAGWYFYSKWQLNNQILDKLNADYAELSNLNKQNPHPGSGQIDNISAAKEQQKQLRSYMQRTQKYFEHIQPIPNSPKMSDQEFSGSLSRTIDLLQHDATNSSVNIPLRFNFSFEAEKQKISFAAAGLAPLATQLGEVKTICQVLYQAKINSLDLLRRERVSPDDAAGPATDYLTEKSVTNELAVITPYELTFRCFSPELAAVLAGFGTSPNGLIVKSLNVEPAPAVAASTEPAAPVTPNPVYVQPAPVFPTPAARESESAAFARRYGLTKGGPVQPVAPPPVYVAPTAPANRGGLPTVLDEKQLKVTLMLEVVKPLPSK